MKNYIDINGKKIKLSDESIANFKKELNVGLAFDDILNSDIGTDTYNVNTRGYIHNMLITDKVTSNNIESKSWNVSTNQRALQLKAIAKLMKVADYFNDGAEVYANDTGKVYRIYYESASGYLIITYDRGSNLGFIYFERREDAEQAINILGEDTIKLALTGH